MNVTVIASCVKAPTEETGTLRSVDGVSRCAGIARSRTEPTAAGRGVLGLALLWFALVLLQLVPLPPALWSALPARAPVTEGFLLRGEPLP